MGREASMAAIDAALSPVANQTTENLSPSAAAPHPAPGVPAPTPITGGDQAQRPRLTADEKRAVGAAREAQSDEEKRAAAEIAAEQTRQSGIERAARGTGEALGNVVRNTGVTLERLPTPGSLMLPLVLLLVFFFLLLPVNGHTRFVWLWLAITGNASIQQTGGTGGNTGGGVTITGGNNFTSGGTTTNNPDIGGGSTIDFSATTSPASNGNFTPFSLADFKPLMTGVEDV